MGLQIGGWLLMKKYDLLRSGDNIVRVLDIQQERVFVIECINRKMPVWMESELLESYVGCTDGELFEISGVDIIRDTDALDADQRKVMHERYTMIAPVVSFIADDTQRFLEKTSLFNRPQVMLIVSRRILTKIAASFLRTGSTFPFWEG